MAGTAYGCSRRGSRHDSSCIILYHDVDVFIDREELMRQFLDLRSLCHMTSGAPEKNSRDNFFRVVYSGPDGEVRDSRGDRGGDWLLLAALRRRLWKSGEIL
jgi:hypothetical protein